MTKKQASRAVPKSVWGPALWTTLHSFAYAYPENPSFEHRAAATATLDSLTHLIPCPECREHYVQNIRTSPPVVTSRSAFAQWVVELHNTVNSMLKKKTWSPEESEQHWTSGTEGCGCAVKKQVTRKTISAAIIGLTAGVTIVVVILLIMSSCRSCKAR